MRDKSSVTVTAEVHAEIPRWPPSDRKQKTPSQLLAPGRFRLEVDDIPVNVEVVQPVVPPVVSTVVSSIVTKVMGEKKGQKDPTKHPFQKQDKKDDNDDDNNNNNKSDSDCQMTEQETQCLSEAVSHVKWMAQETAKHQ